MQVRVSTRHGHLSEASKEKITKKVEKLRRLFDRLNDIQVVVDLKDEHNPIVEVQASAEKAKDFVASEKSTEMMAALDLVLDKLEKQLRRYKEKVVERHRDRDREGRQAESEYTADEEE
ncbi:ribosome hibernation-promoting factor, HPF/YfiA family [Aeoliella mucimassa]|uniref:Ribosome hibernation promoting factor n=1 Tax=Aeoliella mucimassa TaxID=2527972 RepID=A0A518AHU5_9BACT|nr:ribosome-associated translation inhibitor RaiA [Aeoliella mucimassa]QDU54244.1 Ribosome hibernation promoting factor [Aeoliella mucimassa]